MEAKTLESSSPPQAQTTIHEFATAITRISVAQIARSSGYLSAQSTALEALTRIAALHLQSLAESASASAARSCRTQCNLLDVISAIEDLSSTRGFPVASSVRRTLMSSGAVEELRQFVLCTREIPFAKPIPCRQRCCGSGFEGRNRLGRACVRGPEVPAWLPAFPDDVGEKGRCGRKEVYWEEEGGGEVKEPDGEEVKEQVLPWRRERVKFKLKGRGRKKCGGCGNSGGDLKLKRKRICLDRGRVGIVEEMDDQEASNKF